MREDRPGRSARVLADWGFSGPELTEDGIAYHRVGLHVEMGYWGWKNERGFTTTLAQLGIDGTERRAELGVLYAACGLGPAGTAPEGAGTLYVIRKRIVQHTMALRALIARLDDSDSDVLFRRCGRRPPRPAAANDTQP